MTSTSPSFFSNLAWRKMDSAALRADKVNIEWRDMAYSCLFGSAFMTFTAGTMPILA